MTLSLSLPESALALPRRFGFETLFNSPPKHQYHQYLLADLGAGIDLAATVIFAPGRAIVIHDIRITGDGSPAGVDDANTSVWTVTDGTSTIVAETYDTTTVFPADSVQTSLGTVANQVILAGGRVELTVLNGTAANLPPVVVTIEYSDLGAYPYEGWQIIAPDDGTAIIADGVPGELDLLTGGGSDNDEIYIARAVEEFLFADDKPLYWSTRLRLAEANTDDANIICGVMDAVAANRLQDDGAGPPSSYSGAVFFKVDGGTVWQFETSLGSTQITTALAALSPDGASDYHTLWIEARRRDATTIELIPFIDEAGGQKKDQALDANGDKIKHTITLGSPTDMMAFAGVKNGGANAETLIVQYMAAYQLR